MIGRIFFTLAGMCFLIGMYSHAWVATWAEIESVHFKRATSAGYSAHGESASVVGGVMAVGLYKYKYSVGDVQYSGWGTNTQEVIHRQASNVQSAAAKQNSAAAKQNGPEASQKNTAVYQPIKVYYWPVMPTVSVSKRGVPIIAFFVLLLVGVVFWYVGRRYR